jgi:hypothetical protein
MNKRLAAVGLLATLCANGAPCPSRADTITSFAFSLFGGWSGSQSFFPFLAGTFSGSIEPSGYLNLADLKTFGITFVDGNPSIIYPTAIDVSAGFGSLSHFSYNPSLGPASFDFALTRNNPEASYTICIGLSAAFSPTCNPGTFAGAFNADVLIDRTYYASSTGLADIVNTGSVTTGGGTGAMAVPEPSPWSVLALGLGFIGVARYRRRRAVIVAA